MGRVPYTGMSMPVVLVRLHVLVKILFGPYLSVTSNIGDIDFTLACPSGRPLYCGAETARTTVHADAGDSAMQETTEHGPHASPYRKRVQERPNKKSLSWKAQTGFV